VHGAFEAHKGAAVAGGMRPHKGGPAIRIPEPHSLTATERHAGKLDTLEQCFLLPSFPEATRFSFLKNIFSRKVACLRKHPGIKLGPDSPVSLR